MIKVVHPGSRIPDPDPDFLPIPDPGVKKAPDSGSGTLIRNGGLCVGADLLAGRCGVPRLLVGLGGRLSVGRPTSVLRPASHSIRAVKNLVYIFILLRKVSDMEYEMMNRILVCKLCYRTGQ
jgi:hypothetical protein